MTFPGNDRIPAPTIQMLGLTAFEPTWRAMQAFTTNRAATTHDEIWITEHPPVYTLGIASKPEHLLRADTGIPLINIDRGGQITYHGPGQLVVYLLLDLKRRNLGVRSLVRLMEAAVIDLLSEYGITARYRADAPGVYVKVNEHDEHDTKIAALGLRIRRGCCYHGLALNIDMDLTPYSAINPCGYAGLEVTQLRDLVAPGSRDSIAGVTEKLVRHLLRVLA
jgi:lipoyl(octanoyl) transferase